MLSYQHGGDIYRNKIKLDFSVNVNPLGIPQPVSQAYLEAVEELTHYPDSEAEELTQALASHHQLPQEWILCGNGCADLIFQLIGARKPRRCVVLAPTFSEYENAMNWAGSEILHFYLRREQGFFLNTKELEQYLKEEAKKEAIDMLFLCNPNNPTGLAADAAALQSVVYMCRSLGIFMVIDECFCEFLENFQTYSMIDYIKDEPGLLILKAFTKTYALAGLRLGYALCSEEQVLAGMRAGRQPWSVSIPAQRAGIAALSVNGFLDETRALLSTERSYLIRELESLGFVVYPSMANYLFFKNPWEEQASLDVWCKEDGILIRSCAGYHGLAGGDYRICIRKRAANKKLAEVLRGYQFFCSG